LQHLTAENKGLIIRAWWVCLLNCHGLSQTWIGPYWPTYNLVNLLCWSWAIYIIEYILLK